MNTYTLSVRNAATPDRNGVRMIRADDPGEATVVAMFETGARTCDIAILAVDPPEPTIDQCLMPAGAERYI